MQGTGQPPIRLAQLFAAAVHSHRSGQLDQAERLYREILGLESRHADALHLLGVVELQRGRPDPAVSLIIQAIGQNPRVPAFHVNLGNAHRARGERLPAADAFRAALALDPGALEARYNLAVVLQELGQLDTAAAEYRQVVQAKPDHVAALNNLGNVCHARGELDDALAYYERALHARTDFVPAIINRGNLLKARGELDEAARGYRRAVELDPHACEALNNLGLVLLDSAQADAAIGAFERALAILPSYAEARRNLGNALRERGRQAESLACYRSAVVQSPRDAEARLGLAVAHVPVFVDSEAASAAACGAFDAALGELAPWAQGEGCELGRVVGSTQPFYLAYRPADVTPLLSRYGDLVSRAAAAFWKPEAPTVLRADPAAGRVRVMVMCAQVRARHPVWEVLLQGVLAHLSHERLELILCHTGATVDEETRWARTRVDEFIQGPKSVAGWLATVRRHRPDLIFYPEVGMDPVTGALAALRLAPRQVASWGHPVTSGLPTIDVFLSAELLDGPRAGRHYREQLVRLPGTGACTRSPLQSAQAWEAPPSGADTVRFALPHQPIKFDPAHDALLPRIAREVGACEFWIPTPVRLGWAADALQARLAGAFRAQGLDPERYLRRTPWLARESFLGFLDAMDVYLDTVAFSGYTTAWQALHRGMPLVTLEGEFLRQRLAAGLLRQIGLTDGIAQSPDDYVRWAVRLAAETREPPQRAARRQAVREAAPGMDDNHAAVVALERTILDLVHG